MPANKTQLVFISAIFISFFMLFTPRASCETKEGISYESLTLEDCLALAMKYNHGLLGATEKIRELTGDYQVAKSKFYPRLALTSYYERLAPNRLSSGGSPSATSLFKEESLMSISGKQIIFDGLKTRYNTQAAKIGIEAQRQGIRQTADEVAFTVTEAYYRLLEAKGNLTVVKEALQQRQDFANLTKAFFKAGKVTQLDSSRAQAQVSEAELAKVEAENATILAREILSRTIGLKESIRADIKGQLPQEFVAPSDLNLLWQEALKINPEIKMFNLATEQSQTLIKSAKGEFYPEISIQGNVGVRQRDVGGTEGEWLVGIFIDFPIFEGGLTKAQVSKASSQYLQTMEKKQDRLNSLKIDLTSALMDQKNARQGVLTTQQNIITNEEAYNSAKALYQYGKTIGLDVFQSQVDLTNSRFNSIKYAIAYEIAQARIKQIVGGLSESLSAKQDWRKKE